MDAWGCCWWTLLPWSLARDVLRFVKSEEPNPDAELIATCAEFDRLERRATHALINARTKEEDEAAMRVGDAVHARQEEMHDRIIASRVNTIDGVRAQAATLALWDVDILKPHHDDAGWDARLLTSIFCDLLGAETNDTAGARVL